MHPPEGTMDSINTLAPSCSRNFWASAEDWAQGCGSCGRISSTTFSGYGHPSSALLAVIAFAATTKPVVLDMIPVTNSDFVSGLL